VSVSLVDLLGRTVVSKDLGVLQSGQHDWELDVPALVAAGTYIVRIEHRGASAVRPVQVAR